MFVVVFMGVGYPVWRPAYPLQIGHKLIPKGYWISLRRRGSDSVDLQSLKRLYRCSVLTMPQKYERKNGSQVYGVLKGGTCYLLNLRRSKKNQALKHKSLPHPMMNYKGCNLDPTSA